jgi:CRISPR/Cas system CSM-associated protein Csm3 (group 7 of RAMP superfamily)
MNKFILKIELLSDALVGSGENFGAIIDTDIVYDELGLPYIPAKRIKGLFKNSIEQVNEILSTAEIELFNPGEIESIFGLIGSEKSAPVIFNNLYVENYQENYEAINSLCREYNDFLSKESVLNYFTSIRHQIKINKEGITENKSLRTLRVLNVGTKFEGDIIADDKHLDILSLACNNLKNFGTKRNKGLGFIKCELDNCNYSFKRLEELCNQ